MSDPKPQDYIDPNFRKFYRNPLADFNPMAELNKAMDEMNLNFVEEKRDDDEDEEMYYGVVDIPEPDDYYVGVVEDEEEGEEIQK